MMKKLLIFFMASLLLLCSRLSSSNPTAGTEASSKKETDEKVEETVEETVVTFWHSMGGVNQEALDSIVAEYNDSQDKIQVNAEFQGSYQESLPKFHSVGGTKDAPTMIQVQEIGTMSMINSGNIKRADSKVY